MVFHDKNNAPPVCNMASERRLIDDITTSMLLFASMMRVSGLRTTRQENLQCCSFKHPYLVGTAFWLSADGKNAVPTMIRCL
jgi:hypothetical protein